MAGEDPCQRTGNGPARDEKGRILPGQGGALRGGRKKAAVSFARAIRRRTHNGRELIDLAVAIARDPSNKRQLDAIEFLAERLLGKAPQDIEVSGPDGEPVAMQAEVRDAGPEKLGRVLRVLAQAGVLAPAGGAGATPDGDPPEVE